MVGPFKRGVWTQTSTQGECHVKIKTESAVVLSQASEAREREMDFSF
jgi:hypothetical protein